MDRYSLAEKFDLRSGRSRQANPGQRSETAYSARTGGQAMVGNGSQAGGSDDRDQSKHAPTAASRAFPQNQSQDARERAAQFLRHLFADVPVDGGPPQN